MWAVLLTFRRYMLRPSSGLTCVWWMRFCPYCPRWDTSPCSFFRYTHTQIHITSTVHTLVPNMKAACTSETSATFPTSTRWNYSRVELTLTKTIHILNRRWNEGIPKSANRISGTNGRYEKTSIEGYHLQGCDAASMVEDHRRSTWMYCLYLQACGLIIARRLLNISSTLKMEALRSPETSVLYQTTRRHILDDSILQMETKMQIGTYTPCSCPLISGVENRPPQILAATGAIGRCCWGRRAGRH
jgi:hypothetical protein